MRGKPGLHTSRDEASLTRLLSFAVVQNAKRPVLLASTALALFSVSGKASAQTDTSSKQPTVENNTGEIVVTARRREESLQSAPVTVTALSAAKIASSGATTLEGLTRQVPSLFLANASGSFQGGAQALRGIGAGDGNVFGDQAIAYNFDGVPIAWSSPRQFSFFDLSNVQVLKGPQALYYGKNSPGGIIMINSADPTRRLEFGVKAAYEVNAHQYRGEAYISGPLTDTVGGRLAIMGSTMRGWVKNQATSGTIYDRGHYLGSNKEFGARATLKYDAGGPFTARFKFQYNSLRNDGLLATQQRVDCPVPLPSANNVWRGPDDCKANDTAVRAALGTRFGSGGVNTVTGATIPGVYIFGNGKPFQNSRQYLTSLDLAYKLTPALTLASTTGYYEGHTVILDEITNADTTFPYPPLKGAAASGGIAATYGDVKFRKLSQEVRLTSSFDFPINFIIGGFFEHQNLSYIAGAMSNALNPVQSFIPSTLKQRTTAYSGFASVSYKPFTTLEISGGARYSHEAKAFSVFRLLPGSINNVPFAAGDKVPTTVPKRSFHNISPEVNVAWRPNNNVTIYGSWKRGFISGGFNGSGTVTSAALVPDNSYDQEVVQGFEVGAKTRLFGQKLQLNVAAYTYNITGLQVNASLPTNPPTQVVNNAAKARSRGIEADFNWRTPVDGLSLNGAIAYNDARYKSFPVAACYAGQTISMGCDLNLINGSYRNQDLSGAPLVRAPKWAGNIGFDYQRRLANSDVLALSMDGEYTSGFFTDTLNSPGGYQRGYWLLNGSIHYTMHNGLEFAVIGRNLTEKWYFQRSSAVAFSGGPSGTAGPSYRADQGATVSRGREVWLQITYHM